MTDLETTIWNKLENVSIADTLFKEKKREYSSLPFLHKFLGATETETFWETSLEIKSFCSSIDQPLWVAMKLDEENVKNFRGIMLEFEANIKKAMSQNIKNFVSQELEKKDKQAQEKIRELEVKDEQLRERVKELDNVVTDLNLAVAEAESRERQANIALSAVLAEDVDFDELDQLSDDEESGYEFVQESEEQCTQHLLLPFTE